ncbi:MAG: molybdate transport system ATP-binding protein [Candidatus Pseudothioglobus sp.]|jgi:molybdate transport system ATP-binding protein
MQIAAEIQLQRGSGFTLALNLTVNSTGVTALYGASGSGKSTILRLLAGLERGAKNDHINIISDNKIWQNSHQFVPAHARGVGYVSQQAQLFPHLSVRGNLEYAVRRRRSGTSMPLTEVSHWLGINHLLEMSTRQLSGGETQRVAIARVLLSGAQCLLMDEPLGALDHAARLQILPYIDALRRRLDIPVVYVSHALDEITYLADKVYLIDQGHITNQGSVFDLASSLSINSHLGDAVAAVVEGQVVEHDPHYGLTRLRLGDQSLYVSLRSEPKGSTLRLRIPARDVSLALKIPSETSILNVLTGVVSEIESVGEQPGLLIRIKVGEHYILSRITRKSLAQLGLQPGMSVFVQIKTVALLTDQT